MLTQVSFRLCPVPPKFERCQAVNVTITKMVDLPHKRWTNWKQSYYKNQSNFSFYFLHTKSPNESPSRIPQQQILQFIFKNGDHFIKIVKEQIVHGKLKRELTRMVHHPIYSLSPNWLGFYDLFIGSDWESQTLTRLWPVCWRWDTPETPEDLPEDSDQHPSPGDI